MDYDMDCDREELLANFQACTGIDDVGEALAHLEQANWNLLEAVNRVIPQDTQVMPPAVQLPSAPPSSATSEPSIASVPASLHGLVRSTDDDSGDGVPLQILYYGSVLDVALPANETISTLRIVLHAQTDLAPCMQDLRLDGRPLDDPQVRLSALPPGQLLTLQQCPSAQARFVASSNSNSASSSSASVASTSVAAATASSIAIPSTASVTDRRYQLTVRDLDSGQQYCLHFAPTVPVGQVKTDLYALTETPVRLQLWTGWPDGTTDKKLLSETGIGQEHSLAVSRAPSSSAASTNTTAVADQGSDSSSVEYQDASEVFDDGDDSLFVPDDRPTRVPLVPDNTEDELAGVLHFCEQFEERYGVCHPPFYHGTLNDVSDEAFSKPVDERRLLAVYLHHDDSVLANVFCSQLLCSESVSTYLTTNFVCWGWDITFPSNQNRFLERVSAQFGSRTREGLLMSMDRERLPLLLLVMRSRSSTEMLSVVHANTSVDELMGTLIHAHDLFNQQIDVERREDAERRARESVKLEQDLAYQESLIADRAKEEVRRAERQVQEQQEANQRKERDRQESERQQEEAIRETVRQTLESDLPPEPPEDSSETITTIRFRSPDGSTFVRRFLGTETLQVLLNYVTVKGYPQDQYKLISSWPRKDLTMADRESSLEEMKLCPQETLMLQER